MEPQSSLNASRCSYSLDRDSQQKCVSRWSVDLHSALFWMRQCFALRFPTSKSSRGGRKAATEEKTGRSDDFHE
jgi:hypothetical protein